MSNEQDTPASPFAATDESPDSTSSPAPIEESTVPIETSAQEASATETVEPEVESIAASAAEDIAQPVVAAPSKELSSAKPSISANAHPVSAAPASSEFAHAALKKLVTRDLSLVLATEWHSIVVFFLRVTS